MDSKTKINKVLNLDLSAYWEEVERLINIPQRIEEINQIIKQISEEYGDDSSIDVLVGLGDRISEYEEERNTLTQEYGFWCGNPDVRGEREKLPFKMINGSDLKQLRAYVYLNVKALIQERENRSKFSKPGTDEIEQYLAGQNFNEGILGNIESGYPPVKMGDPANGWMSVVTYGDFLIIASYIQHLNELKSDKKEKKNSREPLSVPEKVMLLQELGLIDHVRGTFPTRGKEYEVLSLLLSVDKTNLKKNINALSKPNAGFNPHKHKGILTKIIEA